VEGVVLDELRAMSEFGVFVVNDARVCLREGVILSVV
jgi:hypothetical protein